LPDPPGRGNPSSFSAAAAILLLLLQHSLAYPSPWAILLVPGETEEGSAGEQPAKG